MIAFGAAGATVVAMAAILAVPALDACQGHNRGTLTCLRDLLDDRFRLSSPPVTAELPAPAAPGPASVAPKTPPVAVAEPPVAPQSPPPPVAVAEQPPAAPMPAPTVVADTPRAAIVAQADVSLPPPSAIRPLGSAAAPVGSIAAADVVVAMPPPPRLAVAAEALVPGAAVAAARFAVPAPPSVEAAGQGIALPSPAAGAAGQVAIPPPPRLEAAVAAPFAPAQATATVRLPPPAAQNFELAAANPVEPPPVDAPEIAPVPPAVPTIDAIELDVDGSFVAGDGPAGATMRLYLDGEPVGESPVEEGRWLVDGVPLFTHPTQDLRVEAIEPETGRVLGEAAVTVEVELPEDVAPPAEPAPAPAPEPTPAPAPSPEPESRVRTIPSLPPVVPAGQSDSITILPRPSAAGSAELLPAPASATGSIVALAPPTVLRILPYGELRFTTGSAIVRPGDTLWTLARRHYGHGIHFRTILNANREQIARASRIYPGQVVDLPLVTDSNYP